MKTLILFLVLLLSLQGFSQTPVKNQVLNDVIQTESVDNTKTDYSIVMKSILPETIYSSLSKEDTITPNLNNITDNDSFKGGSSPKTAASWNYLTATGNLGITYSWIDCSGGTSIVSGDDVENHTLNWPFNFSFYNDNYTTSDFLSVCTNGFIRFDGNANTSATAARNYDISSSYDGSLGQIIALGVYDNKIGDNGGYIRYLVTGSSPNRIFTIEYNNMEMDYNDGRYVDFEVSLYETSNKIVLKFGTENTNKNGADAGICSGVASYYDYWGHANGLTDDTWIEYTPVAPCSAPTNQPTSLNLTSDYTSISGSFTAASSSPDGYLVVRSTNSSLSANPVDGVTYSAGNSLGGGVVVQSGSATTFNATGLSSGTQYYFFVFSLNNSSCSGGPVYLTSSPLTGNATTLSPYAVPYSHNFDTQDNWTTGGTSGIWERGNQTIAPYGHSGQTIYGTKLNANYGQDNVDAYLYTPIFSMSGVSNPHLVFWMDLVSEGTYDGGTVQICINDNGTWITIDPNDYDLNAPNDSDVDGLANNEDGWSGTVPAGNWVKTEFQIFNLTNTGVTVTSSDIVQFRFWFGSDFSGNGYQGWYIDDFSIYEPNDETSIVVAPSTQVPAGDVSSTSTSSASAVSVFKFNVSDLGSGDGEPTKVTTFNIYKNSGTADWTDNIANAELWSGGSRISNLNVSITDNNITFTKTTGSFDVADGASVEVTLKIILKTSGIVDNSTMVFEVLRTSHGFVADVAGSTFDSDFGSAVVSNTQTIRVVATQITFTGQPSSSATSGVALSLQPVLAATDINGNVDLDVNTMVTLSNTGTLSMANNSMSFTNGVADFAGSGFMFTTGNQYVRLTASDGSISSSIPSTEIAVDIIGCEIFAEDFNSISTMRDLNGSGGWSYTELVNSPNDWGIATRSGYGNCLTIYNGSSSYSYNSGNDGTEIAKCATLIDATGYRDVTIDFDWKCNGQSGKDYGTIMWSTDGTNWSIANDTKFQNQGSWTTGSFDLSVVDGQTFYIGFRWENDGSSGSNPPFAIDNISIRGIPDFKYNFSYRQDLFVPITGTIVTPDVNDGVNISLPAGFDFKYDGVVVTDVRANVNGWLQIGTSHSANAETNLLVNTGTTPFLAPLWDDLVADGQTRIIYLVSGNAPNRVFTVEWLDVLWGGQRQNFQVKLYETSNVIEFWYGKMNNPSGASASIGINNAGSCMNKLISVTPNTIPIPSYNAEDNMIASAQYLNEGLVYIFNPLVMQSYRSWQSATVCIGQANWSAQSTNYDFSTTRSPSSATISSRNVLAVGQQSLTYVDAWGNPLYDLYGRVLIWNSTPTSNGATADVVLGKNNPNDANEHGACTATQVVSVNGVCFSPDGKKLIVVDYGNNRVLIWNTIPTDMSGAPYAADVVVGQPDFTTNSVPGTPTAASMDGPLDAFVLPNGQLVVSDAANNRVLLWNSIPTTNGVPADVVIGQPDFSSKTAGGGTTGLNGPWGISYSPEGELFIVDRLNERILVYYNIPTSNGAAADKVIGQPNFTSTSTGTSKTEFNRPLGVTISPESKMAVCEFFNHRALVYNQVPASNGGIADYVLGQPEFEEAYTFNDGYSQTDLTAPDDRNMKYVYATRFDLNGRLLLVGRDMRRTMLYGTTPTETSDLEVSIVSDETTVCVYNEIEYTVELINHGGDDAYNVTVNAQLPQGLIHVNYNAQDGSTYNQKSGYWRIPYVAVGDTARLVFSGEVQPSLAGNTSVVAYANTIASSQKDNDFSNNADNATVAVRNYYAPTITEIDDQYIPRNGHALVAFTVDDGDGLSDITSYTATSTNTTLIPVNYTSNIVFGGTAPNKTVDLIPQAGLYGYSSMEVIVTDSHGCTNKEPFDLIVGNFWEGDDMIVSPTKWDVKNNWSYDVPSPTLEAIIPTKPKGGYFPIINVNNAKCEDLYVEPKASVTVNDGYGLHIYGKTYLKSTAYGTASFVDLSTGATKVVNDDSIFVERYITNDAWHYLSSPLDNAPNTVLSQDNCQGYYNGNILDYNEAYSLTADYNGDGLHDWFDGWEWPWYYNHNSDPLVPANGYAYYSYSYGCDDVVVFTGNNLRFNTGTYTYKVTNQDENYKPTGSNPHRGWNLIGNPYPSGLDAEIFLKNNTAIDGTIYFWDEAGFTGFNLEGSDYASYNPTLGASMGTGSGSVAPDKYISSGQAFFVHRSNTDVGGSNITFTNSMRDIENSSFFKSPEKVSKIKLALSHEGLYNETIIGLLEDATDSVDSKYDGFKMEGNKSFAFYSMIGNEHFVNQAIPADVSNGADVHLGFNAQNIGQYTIDLKYIENISNYVVITLEDTYTDEIVNIRNQSQYSFDVDVAGRYDDRFILHFNPDNAPTLEQQIPDITVNEDEDIYTYIPENFFNDIDDGDELSFSLTTDDDREIPSWLSFDKNELLISGFPQNDNVGSYNFKVTATDLSGLAVSDKFVFTVLNVNDAPELVNELANIEITANSQLTYVIPNNTFIDVDAGDNIRYEAYLGKDKPLPAWLMFDGKTGVFSGIPANSDAATYNIGVFAYDNDNAVAFDDFDLKVSSTTASASLSAKTTVYPNPSNGIFTIDSKKAKYHYTITDASGKIIYNGDANSSRTNVDISSVAPGVYILQIEYNKTTVIKSITIE